MKKMFSKKEELKDKGILFRKAAAEGDLIKVINFFENKWVIDIDCVGLSGRTALSYAVENIHEEVISYLIDHNADLFLKDKSGKTPNDYAMINIRISIAVRTYEKGINELKNKNFDSAILCFLNSLEIFKIKINSETPQILCLTLFVTKNQRFLIHPMVFLNAFNKFRDIKIGRGGFHYERGKHVGNCATEEQFMPNIIMHSRKNDCHIMTGNF